MTIMTIMITTVIIIFIKIHPGAFTEVSSEAQPPHRAEKGARILHWMSKGAS